MSESLEYIGDGKEGHEAEMKKFIKKFVSLKPEEAIEMRKKLEEFEMMKMRPEHVVKIIDTMPENSENLNKIFTDVSLDEDEAKKILETVKEFK